MEPEATRQQFPFYNEMQSIFTARMQRMLWAEQGAASSSKKNKAPGQIISSDEDEEDNSDEDNNNNNKGKTLQTKQNKAKKAKTATSNTNISNDNTIIINNLKEMLDEFMKQHLEMEVQWREAFEAREEERRRVEMEWRQRMEALENERLLMEKRWRERDEQRKMREEVRAEKRDALINALLNKIRREDSSNM